ncbi:hypothetical protein SDC9_124032 [bioreactor metagenome]|uniref:Uncharacterized protein n=1 Tax=bioreactor metagenome TaxID=1076179 RepID=A0A645CJD8_9ZZZZ
MPEVPDINTGKHDLLSSRYHHILCLFNQIGNGAVAAPSPSVRDGAK